MCSYYSNSDIKSQVNDHLKSGIYALVLSPIYMILQVTLRSSHRGEITTIDLVSRQLDTYSRGSIIHLYPFPDR
jgi:hypothetical protein